MASDPNAALTAVEAFCESRVPVELRDRVRVECSRWGKSIAIVERRPPWKPELMGPEWTALKVAQLRYDSSADTWSLYCRDSNERW